ncbi:MAG: hypothetical protein AAB757_00175 [Patescibacteria group bacterium]
MLQISKEQLYSRYDSLPQVLKEALFSEDTDNLLWKIGDAHHLSDDKKSILATLVGDVILGFIHFDDFEKQISIDLGIDARIAQSLIVEINKKILAPIKNEIEQNYQAPTAVTDIKRVEVPLSSPITVEPSIIPPTEIKIEKPEEVVKPVAVDLSAQAGAVASGPEALFEEAPAIIHKEEKVQTVVPAKVSLGGLMGIFKRTAEKTAETPQVAAEVELGVSQKEITQSEQPSMVKTEKPKMRVVHYSDLRTPIAPADIFGKEVFKPEASGVFGEQPTTNDKQPTTEEKEKKEETKSEEILAIKSSAEIPQPQEPKIEILKPAAPPIEDVIPKELKFKRVDFKEEISQPLKIQPDLSAEALAKAEATKPMPPTDGEKHEIGLKEIPVSEEVLDLRTMEKIKTENEK